AGGGRSDLPPRRHPADRRGPGPWARGRERAGDAHPPGGARVPHLDGGGAAARGDERGGPLVPSAPFSRSGLKFPAAPADRALDPLANPGGSVALQGTLDTFALPDVLHLLATTKKTGQLRLEGQRGSGTVHLDGGQVVGVEAAHAPLATEPVDALFGLIRFEDGTFAFAADAAPAASGPARDVGELLEGAEALL